MTLSQQRAESVIQSLVASGVDAALLEEKGYGDNSTEKGRFKNRRIEFKVLK